MRNNKVTLRPTNTRNPFYPSPDDVFEFLGFKVSPRAKLKGLAKFIGMELDGIISDRSLDNLAKVGVKPKTMSPIGWKFYRFVIKKKLHIQRPRDIQAIHRADIHIFWMHLIDGLEQGQRAQGIDPKFFLELTYVRAFLEKRNEEYRPQLELIKNFNRKVDELNGEFILSYYKSVIPHTCLLDQEKKLLLKALTRYPNVNDLDPSISEVLFLFLNDFYLSILAVVDFTYVEFFKRSTEGSDFPQRPDFAWPQNGYIAEIMQQEGKCYFGRFITFIKKLSGKSYNDLSTAIPVNFDDTAKNGRTRHDAQKDTLKDWRKGKTRPSIETMNTFFANLNLMFSIDYSVYGLFFQSIDRYIHFHSSQSDQPEDAKQLLEKVFSVKYYQRHYQKAKKLPSWQL